MRPRALGGGTIHDLTVLTRSANRSGSTALSERAGRNEMTSAYEQLRRMFEAQRNLRRTTCQRCGGALPRQVGRGRPRVKCLPCSVEVAARAAMAVAQRVCRCCGARFMPARNSQKFCSEHCQRRSEPSRLRTSRWGQTCLGCGKTMSGRARKFCDVECRSTTSARLG